MIFYRKGVRSVNKKGVETMYDLEDKINAAVFPGHQGGPHNHTITALSVALKQASLPEYVDYQKQVLMNCQVLASEMLKRDFKVIVSIKISICTVHLLFPP